MAREQEVQFEQDRLGNERRRLDTLRAQSGMQGQDTDQGIVHLGTADTGSVQLAYSLPSHADQVMLDLMQGFNSVGSGDNTFSIFEVDLDANGSITSSTRRSVPINVSSGSTRSLEYEGIPFERAIGVESEFEGFVGVAVIVDHKEYNEPDSEVTGNPS